LRGQLDRLEPALDELIEVFRTNTSILNRTRGIGVLTKAQAIDCAVAGPVARAVGVVNDMRVKAPYAAYDRLAVEVPLFTDGDVWSRAMVRLSEAKISLSLLRRCLDDLPAGPTFPEERPEIPAGEAVARCEAPRGELIYYVRTDGSPKPERVKWRVPSYMNWDALCIMLKQARVSDIALIVNSIDPCISCTER
jgi:ech hydrogenase subunit E